MNCWICGELTKKNNVCNCENDYCYVHNYCIEKMITISGNNKCIFCKEKYRIRKIVEIKNFIIWIMTEILNFFIFICEYDLYFCIEWDELFSN